MPARPSRSASAFKETITSAITSSNGIPNCSVPRTMSSRLTARANAFAWANECDSNDEAAQLIDGVECFLQCCLARDVCVISMRKNRTADFFAPAILAQPRNANEWMAFGRATFEIWVALVIHVAH